MIPDILFNIGKKYYSWYLSEVDLGMVNYHSSHKKGPRFATDPSR
jgi:hypothetical protein